MGIGIHLLPSNGISIGIGLLPSIGICICALVENFKQFHNIRKDLETFATKPNYESMKKEAILKGV